MVLLVGARGVVVVLVEWARWSWGRGHRGLRSGRVRGTIAVSLDCWGRALAPEGDAMRDQFYVFKGPDGWAWVEMFGPDETHVTAPGPYREVAVMVEALKVEHPDAVVDDLLDSDVEDAMSWAIGGTRAVICGVGA